MSNPISPKAVAFSLYRSSLRQIRLLPSEYLRQFFRIKIKDDVRTVMERERRPKLQKKRIKLLEWELRKFQSANKGDHKAFEYVLDLAYGRRGKLRVELTEPLLDDPKAPRPEPIIPNVEKSRPPVYSPEMRALLAIPATRSNGKPIHSERIDWPPKLSERAKPDSADAKVWGPLSKRREVNARWGFFLSETQKLFPPFKIVAEERPPIGSHAPAVYKSDLDTLKQLDLCPLPFQEKGVFEEAEAIAGLPTRIRIFTRKEKKVKQDGQPTAHTPSPPIPLGPTLPSRFVRRRYRALLSRVPILTYAFTKSEDSTQKPAGRYTVSFTPAALANHTRTLPARYPKADPSDDEWLAHVEAQRKQKKSGQ